MNDALKFLNNYHSALKHAKTIAYCAVICSAITTAVAVYMSYRYAETQKADKIYILDDGSVMQAYRAENGAQRDLEVQSHVTRFHELILNVTANQETTTSNISEAYSLADRCAYEFVNQLKEQQFYVRLIQSNSSQQVHVDSVKVDMDSYPYRAHTYLTRYYLRPSNITKYAVETSCVLTEAPRSSTNPHGLTISRFILVKNDEIETRNRR